MTGIGRKLVRVSRRIKPTHLFHRAVRPAGTESARIPSHQSRKLTLHGLINAHLEVARQRHLMPRFVRISSRLVRRTAHPKCPVGDEGEAGISLSRVTHATRDAEAGDVVVAHVAVVENDVPRVAGVRNRRGRPIGIN